MKKLLIATAVATTLFAPQAFAQAKNFEGWSIGANVENTKTTTKITSGAASGTQDGASSNLALQGGYAWALGNSFVLGLNLTLGFGENKAGTSRDGAEWITKTRATWSLEPGFAVSDSVLIYGKLTGNGAISGVTNQTDKTIAGSGLGLGVRYLVSKNFYIQGAYDSVGEYTGAYTNVNHSSTAFSLGVGYKF
jgi:outer membrane immunogenic protein